MLIVLAVLTARGMGAAAHPKRRGERGALIGSARERLAREEGWEGGSDRFAAESDAPRARRFWLLAPRFGDRPVTAETVKAFALSAFARTRISC
jgi:hypothetical protein